MRRYFTRTLWGSNGMSGVQGHSLTLERDAFAATRSAAGRRSATHSRLRWSFSGANATASSHSER